MDGGYTSNRDAPQSSINQVPMRNNACGLKWLTVVENLRPQTLSSFLRSGREKTIEYIWKKYFMLRKPLRQCRCVGKKKSTSHAEARKHRVLYTTRNNQAPIKIVRTNCLIKFGYHQNRHPLPKWNRIGRFIFFSFYVASFPPSFKITLIKSSL